jgi:hypothetical protein
MISNQPRLHGKTLSQGKKYFVGRKGKKDQSIEMSHF